MADDLSPADDLDPADVRAYPDPHGAPPVPDGDRVRPAALPADTSPQPLPVTAKQKVLATVVVVIVVAAIVIRVVR
ncbi:hypothetical protein QTQ03_01715 [Micromonospora sp. WMMA1363]|uniref:hypothetical protein n=1 Tax=Micromonospora sp. WMMA1363 TaxID=3053985 RepID=UPI00259CDA2B|nr:hypothetical protein [Micromonospora sp. WMMA1363]MDM4718365.1 hypothetical protein [Micromonospora sp. WMMA1363]